MTGTHDPKTLARIRAILDRANDPRTPAAEAENARNLAQKMMAKYHVEAAVLANTGKTRDELTTKEFFIGEHYGKERLHLAFSIAEAFNCRGVYWPHNPTPRPGQVLQNGFRFQAVGYTSDLEMLELQFTSLWLQASNEMKAVKGKAKRSWLLAFAHRVGQRLKELNTQAVTEHETATGSTGTEIALLDRKALVEQEFERRNPRIRTDKARNITNWDGWNDGLAAGDRADIGGTRVGTSGRRAISS